MEKEQKNIQEIKYGGFWLRFLSLILDSMVINAVVTFVYMIIGRDRVVLSNPGAWSSFSGNPEIFLLQLAQWIYYILMLKYFGASLGKMALKLRVVNKDGAELDWVSIILRETVGKFVSGITLGVGYLIAAWDPKKQSLHDKISGTIVIVER